MKVAFRFQFSFPRRWARLDRGCWWMSSHRLSSNNSNAPRFQCLSVSPVHVFLSLPISSHQHQRDGNRFRHSWGLDKWLWPADAPPQPGAEAGTRRRRQGSGHAFSVFYPRFTISSKRPSFRKWCLFIYAKCIRKIYLLFHIVLNIFYWILQSSKQ